MAKITWLGDDDPSIQIIEQYGHTFVKGEATDVPDKDTAQFKGNRFFHVGGDDKGKPEVVESEEPEAPDPDEGTEVAAARQEAKDRGLKVAPRSSLETIRKQLADHAAKADTAKAE